MRAGLFAKRVGRTALQTVPTVLGVLALNFLLLQLLPGDAADILAAESGAATAESLAAMREHLGLNVSVGQQLLTYLNHLAHGSLGFSQRYGEPVMDLILGRMPGTLLLMALALLISVTVGILLGVVMAVWSGRWPDRALSLVALLLYSTPGFWFGLIVIVVFSVYLGWLPSTGSMTVGADLTGWALLRDRLGYAILPAATRAAHFIAIYARLTRAAMLEVQRLDFVRTAQAKGLHPFRVTVRHVLRNALLPVTTVAGMHLGELLGGAVVVETVFGWPGLGRLTVEAIDAREYNVLLGVLLLSSLAVILANLLVDMLHAWLDPRIRVA